MALGNKNSPRKAPHKRKSKSVFEKSLATVYY